VGGIAAALIVAPPAFAGGPAPRYAEPLGNGPEPCLSADPCSLQTAVSGAPASTSVFMKSGTYTESTTVSVANNVDLRSETGSVDDVVIQSSASIALHTAFTSDQTELEDFTINHTGTGVPAKGLHLEGGIGRRLFVESTGTFACDVTSLLRDSICLNTAASGGNGAGLATPSDLFPQLINVTAIATSGTGVGVFLAATAAGADPVLTGRNVIAEGPLTDQFVSAVAGSSADMNLFNSNFDALFVTGAGAATGTLATENDNQDDPELLDADYRQLPGSPTIDAGDSSSAFSNGDIDHETRIQGDAVDIGADEIESAPAAAPTTQITQKPPKRTRKRKAKFAFTSNDDANSFECKLDSASYADCNSPQVYRKLKRKKHTFRVRAVNTVGTADSTPAKHTWKILKRR
jgi:hypothetical protein